MASELKDAQDLPKGWAKTTLADIILNPRINIVDGPFGSNLKASEYQDYGIPILRIQNIDRFAYIPKNIKFVTPEKAATLERHSFSKGDIIITKLGDPLGKACILPDSAGNGIIVADLIRLRLDHEHLNKVWLCYAINSNGIASQLKALTKGTTRPRVNLTHVRGLTIALPPLNEQRRIVSKVEELFSELDKGIENLKAAREQLKVYRQAVLKHAFEGKLTAQWREKNKDKLETSEQLLDRIKKEYEARYQRELDEWKNEINAWEAEGGPGKKPPKPRKPAEILSIGRDELAELPSLPEGYAYTYLANLGDLGRGKSKHRPRNDSRLFGGPYPFIQTGEVKAANRIIREYSQTYSEFGLEQSKLWPKGTLCITIAANIAETAFLGFDGCFPDSVVGFTAFENMVFPEYVELFIKATRARIEAYAPATAQKNINLTTLENLVIPICSLDEQRQLVNQIDGILSVVNGNEDEINDNLTRTDFLRQSVLKKAFSGQIVPQDPHDEPASTLLERIKAEKEVKNAPQKGEAA